RTGGPEVNQWVAVDVGAPGRGMARIRHTAIGVNFVDIYYRRGFYKAPGGLPFIPGAEAAGVVEAVGQGVSDLKEGDRVVYQGSIGGYSEVRLIPADKLVRLPDRVSDKVAAAVFLKGLTVQCLLRRTFKVMKGQTIVWHAAAGGVGSIATQWAKALGVTVIGTVGSDDKIAAAKAGGADHVINYRKEDWVAKVKDLTGGEGVDVVYDSVGKDTFPGSLDCLKPLGLWASFGQSSGLPPEFTAAMLQQKGSLFATRPALAVYLAKRADLEHAAHELFDALRAGVVKVAASSEMPLREAGEAQRRIETRETSGTTILLP
ncbi:MAG TPA: quinone oxidoreductase, partial [Bauldia sp.]|nr:quinone oxidoreductase [Bauldia sp.]